MLGEDNEYAFTTFVYFSIHLPLLWCSWFFLFMEKSFNSDFKIRSRTQGKILYIFNLYSEHRSSKSHRIFH